MNSPFNSIGAILASIVLILVVVLAVLKLITPLAATLWGLLAISRLL